MADSTPWLYAYADLISDLEGAVDGARARYAIRHGTMRAGIYAPRGVDPQDPHDQDELYIVHSGSGMFVKAGQRHPVAPGDLIFVEAGATHRFEEFSDDFVAWVIFWGARGGEIPKPSAPPGS